MTKRDGQLVFALMRVRELEDEVKRRDERIKWLRVALSELAAGVSPLVQVSERQFSMLVAEDGDAA